MKTQPVAWYRLRWPRDVTAGGVEAALRVLAAGAGAPVVLEAIGERGAVTHRIAVPTSRAGTIANQLRVTIPGLACEPDPDRRRLMVHRTVEVSISTKRRPLRTEDPDTISRTLLTALAHVGRDELIALQWVLHRPLVPVAVPQRLELPRRESWLGMLLAAPFSGARPADPETIAALRAKQAAAGWRAVGRIAVKAGSRARERQLVRQVLGALRTAEAPSVGFRAHSARSGRFIEASVGWRRPLRLNVAELTALAVWPLGSTAELPVRMLPSRLLPAAAAIPHRGRVVAHASFPGQERPVALSTTDSLRHLHAIGPTGSGKSTGVMLNLIVQDMQAGRAVVVIEPKGDLIEDVLARVPANRVKDVVVIDPSDRELPVGLNPLAGAGRPPELVADQLLGMFHALYPESFGPRLADILGASLLTLARLPRMSLAALPLLLSDAGFRRRLLPRVVDPIGLEPFWSSFEAWSEQERIVAIAPVMRRLRPLLLRPEVTSIIAQTEPRFDMSQVFSQRQILLVNLAKGHLGPETASLLGSLVVAQLWQAIVRRSAIAPERRHPAFVFVDEFQDYLHLPLDFADALAQARGLGVGFVLAHQYLQQLTPPVRASVLANAQSRVIWRASAEDARAIASGGLAPEDVQGLGAFECYVQLVANGAVQPWLSAKSLPAPEPTGSSVTVRAASRERYGTPRAKVERELQELVLGTHRRTEDDLLPRRRNGGQT